MRIGKYEFGLAPLSMAMVFIILTFCAIFSALHQARPEYPMPLSGLIIINEGLALIATLVYGIFLHLIILCIKWYKSR